MKQTGEQLTTYLNESDVFVSCDLYEITLKSGISYYYADTDNDVTFGGNTYRCDGPIIKRSKLSTSSEVAVDKLSITIATNDKDRINGIAIATIAHNGGFDGATLGLKRAFFNAKRQLIDVLDLFVGVVEVKQGGGLTLQLDVKSVIQKLNTEYPNKRYYPQCPYCLYDEACGVNIETYRKRVVVVSVVGFNEVKFNTSFADGYYDAGGIEWISGNLVGQTTQIIKGVNGNISFITPSEAQPQIGDEAFMYPGCDKTPETCKLKFNNFNRNRATPYVPLKETIR